MNLNASCFLTIFVVILDGNRLKKDVSETDGMKSEATPNVTEVKFFGRSAFNTVKVN